MESQPEPKSTITKWWDGKGATGDWFGTRTTLDDAGISIRGYWKSYFFMIQGGESGGQNRTAFDQELKFLLTLDFEKLLGIPGLTADGDVRWRDGENPNTWAGASPGFNPSPIHTGRNWRMGQAYFTWKSGDLFPASDLLTISAGWQDPYNFFGVQPLSKFFTNNVIVANKGVGLAGIPWSSSYESWGGYLKVAPVEWAYGQAGLYMAIPGATNTANHGLYFSGASPASANGLFFLAEIGVTPKITSAKLDGKYAVGFLSFGVENIAFDGSPKEARNAVYFQADQRIYREPAIAGESKPNRQGLTWINWFNLSSPDNSNVPFYFHTGVVYEGLLPSRDKDQFGAAFALGSYSEDRIVARRAAGLEIQDTMEAVVELDYKAALNRFISIKPFWQYLIRPNADGEVPNANVFGMEFQVTF